MVPGFILFVLVSAATIRGPSLMSSSGLGSAIIVIAPLVLATYALTIVVMAGRAGVDLSIGPLIGFINVGLIKLIGADVLSSQIAVFLYVIMVGIAYQLAMGLIIVYVRVQPIIVSLSGYLALVGLNLLILPRPGGVGPDWMMNWGSGTTIFSPVLAIVFVATIGWYVIARTAFFGHLRLMGSDERAAYTSGVKIDVIRLGAHCISGVYAGLAAICFTSLISSGDPTQGTTYTLMAVTALVLGGASLSGGRGSALGSLLGALNIYLITYLLATFNFGTVQSYVTDLAYGMMLVGSLLINSALPQIQRAVRFLSPAIVFTILACVGAGIGIHATFDAAGTLGALTAIAPSDAPAAIVAGDALQTGSIILLVVLGLVALVYLISLLVRFPQAPTVALVVTVAVVALGLIFHPDQSMNTTAVVSGAADRWSGYALDTFALEGSVGEALAANLASPLTWTFGIIVALAGIVAVVSVIITLNLFDIDSIDPRNVRLLILGGIALGALVLLTLSLGGGSKDGGLFGRQGLAVLLAAAVLFVVMWSPLQGKLKSVTNVYIIGTAALALGSLYFSATDRVIADGGGNSSTLREIMHNSSAFFTLMPSIIKPAFPRSTAVAQPYLFTQLAYAVLLMVALQFSLWLAMRKASSIRHAVDFGYTIVGAVLAWASLFALVNVSWTIILLTIGTSVITAPIVWRAFTIYIAGLRTSEATTDTTSRGRRPVEKWTSRS